MPIRMEEDEPSKRREEYNPPTPRDNGGRGGGINPNMILMFLPFLKGLFRKPKLLILLIGAAILFYMMSGRSCAGGGVDMSDGFIKGLDFNQEQYDKTEVFEALADNRKNPLPEKISLKNYAPKRLNQGRQGSCVGWAASYAARTILHSRATGQNPNQIAFSPSALYNQIALRGCQGAYMQDAMEVLKQRGTLPFREFPYDEGSCSRDMSGNQRQTAAQYRTKGYNRLTVGGSNYKPDLLAIKQNLAQGAPVVIGMQVGGSFMQAMEGRKLWVPNRRDYNMIGFGGHAMCVIGYDDYLGGGAFEIMNSWGERWGENGIAWVRYKDFEYFVKEACGLYPMGSADKANSNKLAVQFGLVDVHTRQNIPFKSVGGNVFQTARPIKKGDKFKVEVTNTIECYTYIFGEETTGESYVLFPYTPKHSPYCGITGTRLFPRDHSLKADDLGNRDRIAILVTKEPIDYVEANQLFNQAKGRSYEARVNEILGGDMVTGIQYKAGKTITFGTESVNRQAVAIILEIDKE